MKKLRVLVMVWAIVGWAIPKPMESIQKGDDKDCCSPGR